MNTSYRFKTMLALLSAVILLSFTSAKADVIAHVADYASGM